MYVKEKLKRALAKTTHIRYRCKGTKHCFTHSSINTVMLYELNRMQWASEETIKNNMALHIQYACISEILVQNRFVSTKEPSTAPFQGNNSLTFRNAFTLSRSAYFLSGTKKNLGAARHSSGNTYNRRAHRQICLF